MIELNDNIKGKILDIGGGGEGVISSIYGENVVAIDYRKEELDEVSYPCEKLVMDASNMSFSNESFPNVTSFYSFMFVAKSKHIEVINEIYRVLNKGGSFYLWDTNIAKETNKDNPFIVDLNIKAHNKIIQTTFGIIKPNAIQNSTYFQKLCIESGFKLEKEIIDNQHFFQHWIKV